MKEDPGDPNRYMVRNRNSDTGIALTVAANGTASGSSLEIMGTDFLTNRTNYEGLRLTANRNANPPLYQMMTLAGGTGVHRDIQFQVANTEILRLTTSGRVGIGTTTPSYKLDVDGGINATQLLVNGTDVTASAGAWSINGQNAYRTAGNVGIGTATPLAPLDVNGWIRTSSAILANNIMTLGSSDNLTLQTNGTARMTIASSGHVGIGTTAPLQTLEVLGSTGSPATSGSVQNGIMRLTNSTNTLALDFGQFAAAPYTTWIQNSGKGNLANTYPLALNPNGGTVGIGTTSPMSQLDVHNTGWSTITASSSSSGTEIALKSDGTTGNDGSIAYTTTKYMQFFTDRQNHGSASMVIDPAGNVGVGTTTPTTEFAVSAAAGGVTHGLVVTDRTDSDNHRIRLRTSAPNTNGVIEVLDSTETVRAYIHSNGDSYFMGGNIGIGTASPSYKLDVAGAINTTQLLVNGTDVSSSAGAWSVSGSDVYRSTGNIGIGTANPTNRLTVNMGTDINLGFTSGVNDTNAVKLNAMNDAGNATIPMEVVASKFNFVGGNVGIGTTSPTDKIDAVGENDWAGMTSRVFSGSHYPSYNFYRYRGTSAAPQAVQSGDITGMLVSAAYDGTSLKQVGGLRFVMDGVPSSTSLPSRIAFYTTTSGTVGITEKMRIDNAGSVGIGTTTPRSSLDVRGSIISTASTANATTTIDFSQGNIQHTTANCGAFALNNLKDGGSYMFVVKGTSSATCSFTAYTDGGTTALTVHMPPGHGATTVGYHTVYNLAVSGGDVYVAWTPRY